MLYASPYQNTFSRQRISYILTLGNTLSIHYASLAPHKFSIHKRYLPCSGNGVTLIGTLQNTE